MKMFYRLILCAAAAVLLTTGFCSPLCADYMSAVQALNPLRYYQFNDGTGVMADGAAIADSGSQGEDGTCVLTTGTNATIDLEPADGMPGLGNAAYFTNGPLAQGTSLIAHVASSNAGLPSGNEARTINYWVQVTPAGVNSTSASHITFRYGVNADAGEDCACYGWNGGGPDEINRLSCNAQAASVCPSTSYYVVGPDATDTSWHMVTLTIEPTGTDLATWTAYLDGVLGDFETNVTTKTRLTGTNTLYIGGQPGKNGWGGGIAQFSVFGSALTQEQITGLYAAAVPEPSAWILLAGGLSVLALARKGRK